jgi:hypothetical protein
MAGLGSNNEAMDGRREAARRDVQDIRALTGHESFNRYYLRRIRQKQSEVEKAFKYDDMPPADREILRQKLLFIEEILKMPAKDEAVALSELRRQEG